MKIWLEIGEYKPNTISIVLLIITCLSKIITQRKRFQNQQVSQIIHPQLIENPPETLKTAKENNRDRTANPLRTARLSRALNTPIIAPSNRSPPEPLPHYNERKRAASLHTHTACSLESVAVKRPPALVRAREPASDGLIN